jgi:hypothetical protein
LDFDDAQAYLNAHIDLEKTTGISAGHVEGLSLDRMRAVVDVLDNPQHDYPVIHITGDVRVRLPGPSDFWNQALAYGYRHRGALRCDCGGL